MLRPSTRSSRFSPPERSGYPRSRTFIRDCWRQNVAATASHNTRTKETRHECGIYGNTEERKNALITVVSDRCEDDRLQRRLAEDRLDRGRRVERVRRRRRARSHHHKRQTVAVEARCVYVRAEVLRASAEILLLLRMGQRRRDSNAFFWRVVGTATPGITEECQTSEASGRRCQRSPL